MRNARTFTNTHLYALLGSIAEFTQKHYDLYALGGTALTLCGIKPSTIDIDLNVPADQYASITELFETIGFEKRTTLRWLTQEGIAIDLFHGENILGTQLKGDALERSDHLKDIGTLSLYVLRNDDIIISKLVRGDERDFDDIHHIMQHEEIDLHALARRYRETMEASLVTHAKRKFLDLVEIKMPAWGMSVPQEVIQEAQGWQI